MALWPSTSSSSQGDLVTTHGFDLEHQTLPRGLQTRVCGVQSASSSRNRALDIKERRKCSGRCSSRRCSTERDRALLHRDWRRLLLPVLWRYHKVCSWSKWKVIVIWPPHVPAQQCINIHSFARLFSITIFRSGRAPQELSLELLASQGYSVNNPLPVKHAHTVQVPGAAAGWVDTVQEMGSGKVNLCTATAIYRVYWHI